MQEPEVAVDGWAIISELMKSGDAGPARRTTAVKEPRSAPAESRSNRRGWPKGKPRGKREVKEAPIVPAESGVAEPGVAEEVQEPSRKKRRTSSQSRNIIMTPSGLYRPGWFPVRGKPLQRGKGFSTLAEAVKSRDLLEAFAIAHLDTYKELTDQLYEVFAKAIDICAWRTDLTIDQLHVQVWESVKLLVGARQDISAARKYQRRQRVRQPLLTTAEVDLAQLAAMRPGLGVSFIQGLLGPNWRAPARVGEDVLRLSRSLDSCFEQIGRIARFGQTVSVPDEDEDEDEEDEDEEQSS